MVLWQHLFMEVTNRSRIVTQYAAGWTESAFAVQKADGSWHEVSVMYQGTGSSSQHFTETLALGIWNRMTEFGFDAGLQIRLEGGAKVTTFERKPSCPVQTGTSPKTITRKKSRS